MSDENKENKEQEEREDQGKVLNIPQVEEAPDDEPTPVMAQDGIPDEAKAQAEEVMRQRKEEFEKQLEALEADLTQRVAAGQMLPEGKDLVMKAERLKVDGDLMKRRGCVQISYGAFWNFVQTCFEFNTLLDGGRVKTLAMGNNPYNETIDVIFCHEDLPPVEEGAAPPYVKMPDIALHDFHLLLALRKRDAKLLENALRRSGWDVSVKDKKSNIIVPGGPGMPRHNL